MCNRRHLQHFENAVCVTGGAGWAGMFGNGQGGVGWSGVGGGVGMFGNGRGGVERDEVEGGDCMMPTREDDAY